MKRHIGKRIISAIMCLTLLTSSSSFVFAEGETGVTNDTVQEEVLPYLNTNLSFEERTADLVSRMTLEEKISQLGNKAAAIPRLGVSAYQYWREGIHGVARQGQATSFPSSLALSNTWNRELANKIATATSTEARGKNNQYDLSYWNPTINMARDPRWGRNEETYGEDPYLTGQIAGEFVKGMQGTDSKYLKVISTLKHFIANNCEKERRAGSSKMDERTLREYYGRAFQDIVETDKPASAMSSYNATTVTRNGETLYDHIPSAANEYTLTELLRRNWGFDGYVTGDCGAVQDLGGTEVGGKQNVYKQVLVPDKNYRETSAAESIAKGFYAGNDIDCGTAAQTTQLAAVENGYISEDQLDVNVYRLFLQRMKTGEFDDASLVPYRSITKDVIETDDNVAIAEAAAEESWVLLKNDNNILPISKDKKIAIVGNYTDEVFLGDYSGEPTKTSTPLQGLKDEFTDVSYLGGVSSDTVLFNLKSLSFELEDGTTRKIDLSKATAVSGGTVANGAINGVTKNFTATIPNVDFSNVKNVKAEMSADSTTPGGTLKIGYNDSTLTVANVSSQTTTDFDTYTECKGEYTGTSGGYNGIKPMVLTVSPNVETFSVEKYKAQLDSADVIIAYAGTNLSDSSESNDRASTSFPTSQSHVKAIADAYGSKTIVAMQTVGQMNVEDIKDKVAGMMWTSYNGQTQGTAFAKVLSGSVNPSGRLTSTWYLNSDLEKMPLATTAENKITKDGLDYYYNDYSIRQKDNFPGRSYQYYSGTPVYPFGYGLSYTNFTYSDINVDKSSATPNDTVTVTAKITNSGSVKGKEVAQLYVKVPNANGTDMPLLQLKGFEKVELEPAASTEVKFEVALKDIHFFDEAGQKIYVPEGQYSFIVAKNANDAKSETALKTDVTVSGTLNSVIKTVTAIPTGITVKGVHFEGGNTSTTETPIKAQLSAYMTDEVKYDLSKADVKYESSNTDVALVDENGTVTAGTKEGVATITATVTIDGNSKSTSFPVTCEIIDGATPEQKAELIAKLDTEYSQCVKEAYSTENYEKLTKIYNDAKELINLTVDYPTVVSVYNQAIKDIRNVDADKLTNVYSIASENPAHIYENVIDYRTDGIPVYDAQTNTITGTVTDENPVTIQLKAFKGDTSIDGSKLKWKVEKLGEYNREPAEINYDTGVLAVKENGLIKITAMNTESLECGSIVVLVNIQLEGEFADDKGVGDITDHKDGASGSSTGGNNIGSTKDSWVEYKGVRLEGLKQIIVRNSYKTEGDAVLNVSLGKDAYPADLLATGVAKTTGNWAKWAENTLDVKQDIISNAVVDENGLSTIYVQSNGANIDYIRFIYEEPAKYHYTFKSAESDGDGAVKVTVSHKLGSENGVLIGAVFDENGKMTKAAKAELTNSGTYTLSGGFSGNDEVSLFVWNNIVDMKPISDVSSVSYKEMELVAYNFSDSKYDDFIGVKGGADGILLPKVDDLEGYSLWVEAGAGTKNFKFRGKTFNFSRALQAGSGGTSKRCVFFTPKSACRVTAVFDGNGSAGREMNIEQNGTKLAVGQSLQTGLTTVSADITDTTKPVYIYGGGSNKKLYAVFVEYK